MPGFNGKGPQGAGPKTGRGLGNCKSSADNVNAVNGGRDDAAGRGLGLRRGRCAGSGNGQGAEAGQTGGQGSQRGMRQGRGAGAGQGKGQGRGAGSGRGAGRGRL